MAKRLTVIGTPHFLAPEVVENDNGYGPNCDIWSLGITLIEMAETTAPYGTLEPMRVLFMIPSNPPPTLQNPELYSKSIKNFLSRCLIKDPSKRPSASELLRVWNFSIFLNFRTTSSPDTMTKNRR